METIKNYILGLAAFSFIASLIHSFLSETPTKRTVRFVCGIVMAILILSPIIKGDFSLEGIFPENTSYNLYNNDTSSLNELSSKVISDKVSEIVEKAFGLHGIENVSSEVIFDDSGNILSINISKWDDTAVFAAANSLGVPPEIFTYME